MSDTQLQVDPGQLVVAAGRLDALADRLEKSLASSSHALTVPAPGRDEVSTTSAATFNAVADEFAGDSARGVEELRKIAAVLRAQAGGFTRGEETAAEAFRL